MDFARLLQPKSVAVVGVSMTNERHPANVIYNKNLFRYPVKVYAVNPKGGDLQGEQVYARVSEIPEAVDLVVIAARAETVPATLADCIAARAGGAVLISGGFAESGRAALQEDLVRMARAGDFPFLGPNCLGIYAPAQVDTFFLPGERMVAPAPGGVALISQSGGILVDQMIKFAEEGIGLSLALSIGNKALVREMDLLPYLAQDGHTHVIAFYLEGFGRNEGREFVLAAGALEKPVIVLKSGKSSAGQRAVSSHTASLAGDYEVFRSVLAQHGVVEARSELELVSFCEALSCYRRAIGDGIAVLTGSGGHGAMAVDACSGQGIQVPPLAVEAQEELRARLSPSVAPIATLGNPVDLTGSATDDDFAAAADYLGRLPQVNALLALLLPYSPGVSQDLGARLSQVARRVGKPLVAYVPHVERYRVLIEGFELNRVPVSPSIEGAVLMVEAMRRCRPC